MNQTFACKDACTYTNFTKLQKMTNAWFDPFLFRLSILIDIEFVSISFSTNDNIDTY